MKMNTINKFLLYLFFCLAAGACEEILEPEESNIYTKDRINNDPLFAEGIMLRAYTSLPTSYGSEDAATDDAVSNNKTSAYLRMATGQWAANYDPLSIWSACYNAVFNVNYFLSIVDDASWSWESVVRNEMFKRRLKGEAYALRAFHHMRLLMYYGGIATDGTLKGVPYVTEVLDPETDGWKKSRETYQGCVDKIVADFDKATALLPYTWVNIAGYDDSTTVYGVHNKNRINSQIVKALKARLALHIASPAYNNGAYDAAKCAAAATLAGEMLAEIGGTSGLNAAGIAFYDADNDINIAEILWRNNAYSSRSKESQCFPPSLYGNGDINPTQNLVDAFPMKNGYPILADGSGYNPDKPYADRDPRLALYILYDGNKLGSTTIGTHVDDPSNGINRLTTSTRTGYYLRKMLRPDVNLNPASPTSKTHIYNHVRYTELFLIYAEAANQAWGPDGDPNGYGFTPRTVLRAIRNRAGITPAEDPYLASLMTKDAMAGLIRNERRLELCFEGFRFQDLRRWKLNLAETATGVEIVKTVVDGAVVDTTFTKINVESRNYQPYMYYAPIPNTEILKNENLLQNQGW